MNQFEITRHELKSSPKNWLITGAAGFIGSNLLETLLKLDQKVVGMDNFSTGHRRNLDEVKKIVTNQQWRKFKFIEGDICDKKACDEACKDIDYVLHHAALGSVPLSIEDPVLANGINVNGFLNVLVASKNAKVKRFVYAASSSTYGDDTNTSKIENKIGTPLSPYAVTKLVNELYANVFARTYGFDSIGLRYFNIFGRRQDPLGAYAAVIPKWITSLIKNDPVQINGDGETTRDFCYIENVIQANLLAATTKNAEAVNEVYNIAVGESISLNTLYSEIQHKIQRHIPNVNHQKPTYCDFRDGDIRHSLADVSKARKLLGYTPIHRYDYGLEEAVRWYIEKSGK